MKSGRPRGPGKPSEMCTGFAPHFRMFPRAPGVGQTSKTNPKTPGQTAFKYPMATSIDSPNRRRPPTSLAQPGCRGCTLDGCEIRKMFKDRKSVLLGVRAAPGAPETCAKGGRFESWKIVRSYDIASHRCLAGTSVWRTAHVSNERGCSSTWTEWIFATLSCNPASKVNHTRPPRH